ncbi:MAG: HAD hydrolase-like protein, partial [Comamonadaceae bacterium]|nr:HAD hydrolase-like protein [Comamonadaceae bacterium]
MTAVSSSCRWMGRPVRAVMIDLDGTLIHTLGDFEAALNQTLHALGRPAIKRAQIECMVGRGSQHLLQAVLAGQTPAPDAALLARAWDEYQRAYLAVNGRHSQPYPGVREGLAALRARGLPLACVTNKPLAFTRPLLAHHGLDGFFS